MAVPAAWLAGGGGAGGLGGLGSMLGGVGAIGSLFGGKGANRDASGYNNAAGDILNLRRLLMQQAGGLAQKYDPVKEAQASIDQANKTAGATLGSSLKSLNTEFKNAGGTPGGDTLFDTNVDRVAKGVFDPLRQFMADKLSSATMDKIQALSAAMGMGGGVAEGYMNLANNTKVDNTGALGLLSGAIDKIKWGGGSKSPGKVSGVGGAQQKPSSQMWPGGRRKPIDSLAFGG